jgi:hypothetical protein
MATYMYRDIFDSDEASNLSMSYKSKIFKIPFVTNLNTARVEGEASGNTTSKTYVDEVLTKTKTISNENLFRLPPKKGDLFKYELSGTEYVDLVEFSDSAEEINL